MKNSKFIRGAFIFVAAGLLLFLGFTRINFESPVVRMIEKPGLYLFSRISYISSFFSELSRIRHLTEENVSLREENTLLLSRIASQLQMGEENKSLREALNLPVLGDAKVIDAGTFNIISGPEGHRMLINKGHTAGVTQDSSVISPTGVLVGRVLQVFDSYSVVGTLTDPEFKATVRVMATDVSGIARGSLQEGLFIDFISQGDEVKEGDMIVTDGNDLSPPGLIIGKVSFVSTEDGNVFKKVQVEPTMNSVDISKVMVLIR